MKSGPVVPVHVSQEGLAWHLLRDGKPYMIKGAGGTRYMDQLVAAGGNSVRTWGADDAGKILDEAQSKGLTVLLGIWLGHKNQGFHYDDPAQVAQQLAEAKAAIQRYRNHPALLAWGIGNEMENDGNETDPNIWNAVEAVAKAAKQLDPNHPTMTVIAEIGGQKLPSLKKYCPSIDIVGINSYGGGASIKERYEKANVGKPYVLTEFGPLGQWEAGKTAWGAPIEPTSTEKAARYRDTYGKSVLGAPGLCLGSYAFVWGNKQEATATWFGMFLPNGEKLASVDTMTELWSGKPPVHAAPKIESFSIDGPTTIAPGTVIDVKLSTSGEGPFTVKWELRDEATVLGSGGSHEPEPKFHPQAILNGDEKGARVKIPNVPVAYRLFVTVHNASGGAATANLPLLAK